MCKMAMAMDSEEWIVGGMEKVYGQVVLHGAEKLGREASSACLVSEIQVCVLSFSSPGSGLCADAEQ